MGAASTTDYEAAIRKLFPTGDYWDRQFADDESGARLFCRAKAPDMVRPHGRMRGLFTESGVETTVETIEEWERVLLGYANSYLSLEERRDILLREKNHCVNRIIVAGVAGQYGLRLLDLVFPFKPVFFGFSLFGRSFFSRLAFFSVIYSIISFQDEELKAEA